MSRHTSSILPLVAALAFGATRLSAQAPCAGNTCPESWSATVTVQATISCAVTQNFDFGSHPASAGVVEVNELTSGRILCTTDAGNHVSVSFTLPASLSDGQGHTVPLEFGAESARLYDCAGSCGGSVQGFNPATGFTSFLSNSGNVTLTLGENGPGGQAQGVFVDLTGARAGVYTGTITATIALN